LPEIKINVKNPHYTSVSKLVETLRISNPANKPIVDNVLHKPPAYADGDNKNNFNDLLPERFGRKTQIRF
jgi:hypothetical protein